MRTAPTREERKAQTRADLIAAADLLFTGNGFHATSLDVIADEAGYTKGAVYSSFASKEDLFFAVYEQRSELGIAEYERELAAAGGGVRGLDALALAAARRRGRDDDAWLAVFFEFWAHVVRRPALRARFAEIHLRVQGPLVEALESDAREHGYVLPDDPRKLTVAVYAMQMGLSLERLTLPELVDERLGLRMGRLFMDDFARAGAHSNEGPMTVTYQRKRLADFAAAARLSRELAERERWPRERLAHFQQQRLDELVRHAVAHSPFYRERICRPTGPVELRRLPTLDKATLMDHFDELVTDPRLRRNELLARVETVSTQYSCAVAGPPLRPAREPGRAPMEAR